MGRSISHPLSEYPNVAKEFDLTKNYPLAPDTIGHGYDKNVWWICPNGHSYEARPDHRTGKRKSGCPYCGHKKPIVGETDLKTIYPEIAAEWDSSKNDSNPEDYLPFSNKSVHWLCPICRKSYSKKICDRTLEKMGCTHCTKPGERSTSQQEQTFAYYLEQVTEVQSRIKIDGMEIDIFLPTLNAGVEYNGEYFHKERTERDTAKYAAIANARIRLILVRCGRERFVGKNEIVLQTKEFGNPTEAELSWAVSELFKALDLPNIDVDVRKDSSRIYARYINVIKRNNLAEMFPEIAEEWNYDLNAGLTPEMFQCHSNKKMWWVCPVCGSNYPMVIGNRTGSGMGCPYCAGKKVKKGFNDLATLRPDLVEEWSQANKIRPDSVTKGSKEKVKWVCKNCGYKWEAAVYSRNAGRGCPQCAGKVVTPGYNDLQTLFPEIAKELDHQKNKGLDPSKTNPGSEQKVWWKCSVCSHEWETQIAVRTRMGCGCPNCSKVKAGISRTKTSSKTVGSLAEKYPEVAKEWDHSKNGGLTPEDVSAGSSRKVWWKCGACGHEWKANICTRTKNGYGCPECGKKRCVISAQRARLKSRGTLTDKYPLVAQQWDYEKNFPLTPDDVTAGSNKRAWWICSKGHKWDAVIRTRQKCGCPYCAGIKK